MVVVGPEDPLVRGIYDYFRDDPQLAGTSVIGPSKAAAQLEGSKEFAKQFMQRHTHGRPSDIFCRKYGGGASVPRDP